MKTQNTPNPETTDSTVVGTTPVKEAKKPEVAPAPASAPTPKAKTAIRTGKGLWQSVLVGGVPGILIGALGENAVEDALAEGKDFAITEEQEQAEEQAETSSAANFEVHEAHCVNDDMSFSEAFAAARAEVGPGGAFVWHGGVYGTYRADDPEWQEMTAEDRAAHSNHIMSQVHPVPYTPQEDEPEIIPVNTDDEGEAGQADDPTAGTEDIETEVDVHIVGVETFQTEDGGEIQVGFGEVDGMDAAFIDSDGDGEVDTVLIDTDNDGEVGPDEVFDAEGSGIMVDDLIAEAEANNAAMPDDQLYSDMPDYTNDADIDSLT